MIRKPCHRPHDQKELNRVIFQVRRIRSMYPESIQDETDIARTVALVHLFGATVLTPDQWRRSSHDNTEVLDLKFR